MALMPSIVHRLLPNASRTRMAQYDIICLHTMVGSLDGTDGYFRRLTNGVNSHFGTDGFGKIYQWVDTAFRSGANMNGNHRVISIENADIGAPFPKWNTNDGGAVPAFTDAQMNAIAQIIAWACREHNIPCELIPDAKPGRRGIGFHRQGVPGYAVAGAEMWSSARGKVCPGNRRIAQIPEIIRRAQALLGQSAAKNFAVVGAIRAAYDRKVLGNATWAFFLGKPKGPEVPTFDKVGRWQEFEKGAIYWHPDTVDADGEKGVAHVIWGDILRRWRELGSENWKGYPTSDEQSCPDTVGRMSHFVGDEFGPASIYAYPGLGSHPVHGLFRKFWGDQGWETGKLGYPTSGEYAALGTVRQNFQGGVLQLAGDSVEVWPL